MYRDQVPRKSSSDDRTASDTSAISIRQYSSHDCVSVVIFPALSAQKPVTSCCDRKARANRRLATSLSVPVVKVPNTTFHLFLPPLNKYRTGKGELCQCGLLRKSDYRGVDKPLGIFFSRKKDSDYSFAFPRPSIKEVARGEPRFPSQPSPTATLAHPPPHFAHVAFLAVNLA